MTLFSWTEDSKKHDYPLLHMLHFGDVHKLRHAFKGVGVGSTKYDNLNNQQKLLHKGEKRSIVEDVQFLRDVIYGRILYGISIFASLLFEFNVISRLGSVCKILPAILELFLPGTRCFWL